MLFLLLVVVADALTFLHIPEFTPSTRGPKC